MPYVTSIERLAREEGRQEGQALGFRQGLVLALEIKFGAAGLQLFPVLDKVADLTVLRTLQEAVRSAATVDELRPLLE